MSNLANELRPIIKGDVLDEPNLLNTYSHDASIFEVKPLVAVAPRNSEDIKALVRFANSNIEEKISLTVRSGATDMTGGPLNDSIILDVAKYFNRILEVGDSYAITQPGVFYRDFEKATLAKNLLLPSYPASREICTVGGMVANNAGGEKTLTYGQTKQYIQQLKVVLADGNEYEIKPLSKSELDTKIAQQDFEGQLYRSIWELINDNQQLIEEHKPHVSKNSSGYFLWDVWDGRTFDLTKLFAGSQGTLGIITEITFRLIQPKKYSQLLVIFLHDLEYLADVIKTVLSFKPESFESYDDKTFKLAIRFLPEFVKLLGMRNIFSLGLQFLPELGLLFRGGIPKLVLLAEFTGDDTWEVKLRTQEAQKALKSFKIESRLVPTPQEAQKYWTIRRESFNLLRHHVKGKQTVPFIDDMVVRPEQLPKFLPQLEKLLEPYNLTYSIAGHAGDGNFHIIPLMTVGDPKIKEIILELSKKVYNLVLEFHGSITGEHNDGLIRSPFLKQMYGEQMYGLFEQVKKIFDPHNIFNPRKKVGASYEYAMAHIRRA